MAVLVRPGDMPRRAGRVVADCRWSTSGAARHNATKLTQPTRTPRWTDRNRSSVAVLVIETADADRCRGVLERLGQNMSRSGGHGLDDPLEGHENYPAASKTLSRQSTTSSGGTHARPVRGLTAECSSPRKASGSDGAHVFRASSGATSAVLRRGRGGWWSGVRSRRARTGRTRSPVRMVSSSRLRAALACRNE